jgi:hypothetical protein
LPFEELPAAEHLPNGGPRRGLLPRHPPLRKLRPASVAGLQKKRNPQVAFYWVVANAGGVQEDAAFVKIQRFLAKGGPWLERFQEEGLSLANLFICFACPIPSKALGRGSWFSLAHPASLAKLWDTGNLSNQPLLSYWFSFHKSSKRSSLQWHWRSQK